MEQCAIPKKKKHAAHVVESADKSQQGDTARLQATLPLVQGNDEEQWNACANEVRAMLPTSEERQGIERAGKKRARSASAFELEADSSSRWQQRPLPEP
jgi:hypothetical protein